MERGKINGNSVVLSNNRTTIIESCPGDRETANGDRVRHERVRFMSKTSFGVDEGADNSRNVFLQKLLHNRRFRHKVLHTLCVGLSMISMGWRQAMIGPTFPDLMLIIDNNDLSKASWIFTMWSLGNLLGSLGGGAMYDRMNRLTVFIFLLIGLAVTTAMTPYCTVFATILFIHILGGLFSGSIDAVCTTDVIHVWQHESGPFMQAVHFGFSLGAILSPLIASPFLAKRLHHDTTPPLHHDTSLLNNNASLFNSSNSATVTAANTTTSSVNALNVSLSYSGVTGVPLVYPGVTGVPPLSFDSSNWTSFPISQEYGETKIHTTYLISSILSFMTACLFGILFFCLGSVYERMNKREMPDQSCKTHHIYPLSKNLKIVFSLLISVMLMLYVITERHFYSFLMTFVIESLHWSKAKGSNATATFWVSFAAGRLTAIFIVKRFTQTCILVAYLIIVIIGVIGFSTSVIYRVEELIWISLVVFGIGMSPIFASIFSWFSENVLRITGKVTGALYICSAVGPMLLPLLTGYLMSSVSYNWFIYLLIMLVVLLLFLFVSVDTVYKYLIKKK